MNRLLIIFTAYLLMLPCFPCMCDDAQEIHAKRVEISKSSPAGNNSKDDNCNPFCLCFCCPSSAIFYQKEIKMQPLVAFYSNRIYRYSAQRFISYDANAIWQPPKLS